MALEDISTTPSSPLASDPLTGHSPQSNSPAGTPDLDLGDEKEHHYQGPSDTFGDFSQQIQVSPFTFEQNAEIETSDHESITPSNLPYSSRPPPAQTVVQSSSPIQLTPNPSLPFQHHQQPDHRDEETARELANNSRRYSMRERRPHQLNPYIYDKMLYKRQMKSNPDAIVRFASPRRRSHSRGGGAQNSEERDVEQMETQGWVVGMDLDEEGDESWVERRQRRRARSKNGGADTLADDAGDASMYLELESSDDDQPDMKRLLKEAKKVKEKALRREREEADEKARREKAENAGKEAGKSRRSKPFPVREEQVRARAKHVEEPDGDVSTGDRRSRSSVGDCFSVASMVLIWFSRPPCTRTFGSNPIFQPHLEPLYRQIHQQHRHSSPSSPPPCVCDPLLVTMTLIFTETLTKPTWPTWKVALNILPIPRGTLREVSMRLRSMGYLTLALQKTATSRFLKARSTLFLVVIQTAE